MSELAAIWVAGGVILALTWLAGAAFLRFTRVGRAQDVSPGDLLKVLVVCVTVSCGLYSLLALVT